MVPGLNDKKQIKLESWEPDERKMRNKGKKMGEGLVSTCKTAEIPKVALC